MLICISAQPDIISDEDGNDSEADNAVVGCLGFLPMPGNESPTRTLSPESEIAPSKTDIAAASPGAVGTDPETQSAFRQQRAEAEMKREKESLDINHLQKQYMRMRKIQKKNMLVFNSFSNQSTRPKNEMRSKAINHLFIDLPNFDKEKRRVKNDRYPFNTPKRESFGRSGSDERAKWNTSIDSTDNNGERDRTVGPDSKASLLNAINSTHSPPTRTEIANGENISSTSKNTAKIKLKKKWESQDSNVDSNLNSGYFKVDRNAMYPVNFKPFPQRNQTPKSKLLIGNQTGVNTSKVKTGKTNNAVGNAVLR